MSPDVGDQFWGSYNTEVLPHEMDNCVPVEDVSHELLGVGSETCKGPALPEEGATASSSNSTTCSTLRGVETRSAIRYLDVVWNIFSPEVRFNIRDNFEPLALGDVRTEPCQTFHRHPPTHPPLPHHQQQTTSSVVREKSRFSSEPARVLFARGEK